VFVHCGVLSLGVRKKLGLASRFAMGYSNPLDLHSVALSVPSHEYHDICGEREGVEFAKRPRRDVTVHSGGGATKKSMPSRCHPSG
jgi:hypothetical protein